MDTATQVLNVAEQGERLGIVGILIAIIVILLIALYFLVRHYVTEFKNTQEACKRCQEKLHEVELALASIAASTTMEEVRQKAALASEKLKGT